MSHEDATPRPWIFTGDVETVFRTVATDPYREANHEVSSATWEADAALIVAAVNDYDRLRAIEDAARALVRVATLSALGRPDEIAALQAALALSLEEPT